MLKLITLSKIVSLYTSKIILLLFSINFFSVSLALSNPAENEDYELNRYFKILKIDSCIKLADLKEDLKGNCVFRPHPQGINNDNFEAWIKSNNMNVDFSQTILDSLINSKIIIVDSLSTTWIEILYLNIPSQYF